MSYNLSFNSRKLRFINSKSIIQRFNFYNIYFFHLTVTVPVTDSIFAATGGFTQSSNNSAPYLPLPLELVKNWNTGTVAFSQVS